jgi:hypothetical protein
MKYDSFTRSLVVLALAAAWRTNAQPSAAEPSADSANRFGLSYRMGFNISTSIKNNVASMPSGHFVPGQGLQQVNPGPATGGGINRTYEDGYVWVDNNNNSHLGQQLTWYWGYDSTSQASRPGSVLMHSSTAMPAAPSTHDLDDPQSGFELNYQRQLFTQKHWRGGLETAFGYMPTSLHDNSPQSASVMRIEDAYALPLNNGVPITPLPPNLQQGTFEGPGDLISDSPTRTTSLIPNSASIVGQRAFSADIFSFRFGPYIEFPISDRLTLALNGGLALASVSSDFSFQETTTITGVSGSGNRRGSGSHSDWLAGGYVGLTASFDLGKNWAAFAGAQFQSVGRYTQSLDSKQAVLDLTKSIFVNVGISYSF